MHMELRRFLEIARESREVSSVLFLQFLYKQQITDKALGE